MVIIMGIAVVDVLTLSLVTIMAITTQAAEKMVKLFLLLPAMYSLLESISLADVFHVYEG